MQDDDKPRLKSGPHRLGQDVSAHAVTDLDALITALESEIERIRGERDRKKATQSAANALFRLP